MSEPVWYRSLYWRMALGLVAFLALMLAAQGTLFLWMSDRIAGSMPARNPLRLAFLVASDVGAAIRDTPDLDLDVYISEQYGHIFQAFVVTMRDGRMVSNQPAQLTEEVRTQVLALDDRRANNRDRRDRRDDPGLAGGFPVPPERLIDAPVVVAGDRVGRVTILPGGPSYALIATRLGPLMGLMGGSVLVVGSALIALFVFGPARTRLKHLRAATIRLGAGDLTARAPEAGGDEVAALARSFNRMGDELASRAQALEASDRARRQLLADVSHELMTPLTAMRGYVETLGMAELAIDRDTQGRYLGIITEETHRLERIIGDLLDLARLEGGGLSLRREPVDVAALFARVAERHERETAARGIRLSHTVQPGAEHLVGDPNRLEQALQNLAANALRHTPDGGAITLDAAVRNSAVHLVVRDTGPGIAAEHLPLIFDRFYKADVARKAAGGGSGLGLSIVKAIVERHGGTITARTDAGAVFDIALPRPVTH
jgi:two-component system OmpR family sensor kinase